jgi:hypothetical protein
VDFSYVEALEYRHEQIGLEIAEVTEAIRALEQEPGSEEQQRELDVKSQELLSLGKDKARIFAMLQNARTKPSNT